MKHMYLCMCVPRAGRELRKMFNRPKIQGPTGTLYLGIQLLARHGGKYRQSLHSQPLGQSKGNTTFESFDFLPLFVSRHPPIQ